MIKEVYFTEVKWKPTHDDLGGVSGKIVFKKPVSYQDYLSISRKEYLLLDENKDKEIERLNNIIKEVREYIRNKSMIVQLDNKKEFAIDLYLKEPEYKELLKILDKGSDKE